MAKLSRAERLSIARKRLLRLLERHGVATWRTIEQKIADSGPYGMRIDPHHLTPARKELEKDSLVIPYKPQYPPESVWFHLAGTSSDTIRERLEIQLPVYQALQDNLFKKRLGQVLEIAIFRSLEQQNAFGDFLGSFINLDEHDDSQLYQKEEPPRCLGKRDIGGDRRLDFLVRHPDSGWAGIEAKNAREWIYPNRKEVIDLLSKCVALDIVPVLIARRIHYSTFVVLNTCGVIVHQTYNQLFPSTDSALAEKAKHKNNLGYHDIRIGNHPDGRLMNFIGQNLFAVLPEHRAKFDKYKDLLAKFADGSMLYPEFAARVRRRRNGTNEDADWAELEPDPPNDDEPYDDES